MRKTIEKEEVTQIETKEVKQEFTLKEAFALWSNTSKSGIKYLSGLDLNKMKVVGYFNTNKKNPKEPDVRVYEVDSEGKQGNEIASLWSNVSKNGNRYLSGITDEKEKLVAFFGKENEEARPYIRAYFQEN